MASKPVIIVEEAEKANRTALPKKKSRFFVTVCCTVVYY